MRKTSTALLAAAALAVGTTLAAAPAGALPLPDLGSVTGALGSLSDLLDDAPGGPGTETPEPEDPDQQAPGEDGPQVTFDVDGPYADGQTVTVTGEGFSGENFGIYVGLVQDDRFSAADASVWMSSRWVEAADIVDGTWTQELTLDAVTDQGDCLADTCSIYTVSAHGVDDPSQTTRTPVRFE